jgi:long-chain acyl-CoA synthetase
MITSGRRLWATGAERFAIEDGEGGTVRYRHRPPNILHLIEESVARHPEKTAVADDSGAVLTYRELWLEAGRWAGRLRTEWGVGPGCRVALLLPGGTGPVALLLGVLRSGAAAVPLNTKLASPELRHVLDNCDPELVVVAPGYLPKLQEARPDYPARQMLVWGGGDERAGTSPGTPSLAEPAEGLPDPGEDEYAALIYTSGTAGKPKGVILTHGNVVHSVLSYAQALPLSEEDTTVIAVPLFYVTGLVAQLLLFLALGGTSAILRRFDQGELLRLLTRHRATFLHAVETVFIRLREEATRAGADLPALRLAACGGGPVMPRTIAELKAWLPQLDFRPVYGLTETTSPASIMPVDVNTCLDRVRSAGRPIPVVDCRVVDEAGEDVAPGEVGELLLRGPVVSPGYFRNPEATAAAFHDGWFATGDLARLDEDGFLHIQDRKKDMIIRGGEKVFPTEVEAVLTGHPAVVEAAVVGVPDPVYGEAVRAFIVLAPGASLSGPDLEEWLRKRLARYKVPTAYAFLADLPRSANGKVLRRELRARG